MTWLRACLYELGQPAFPRHPCLPRWQYKAVYMSHPSQVCQASQPYWGNKKSVHWSTSRVHEWIDQKCKYPSRWKMGQVRPLFKKNDESSEENYWPVTVLPTLNNVFEKLLASQLDQFYSEILSDYISAYRRHYSCESALTSLTEDWRRSLDNKQIVAVISMDLSKAFDTIPHGLLLAKLKAYGVNSRSCSFLKITYTVGCSGWK